MDSGKKKKIVLVLVGPTGVGKTYLATLIAQKLPVEIVSADSRQIYRYLDIGTAKPGDEILGKVLHHLVGFLDPDQSYSAGQFREDALKAIQEISSRKKIPLIAGGSGLYIKALFDGFFRDDVRDEKIRESLLHRLEAEGSQVLYQDLLKVDEDSAKKIHPNNSHRIVRALEVYLASGMPLSDLQKKKMPKPPFLPLKFGIEMDRKKLYRQINNRVDGMFNHGFLAEVAHVLDMGYEKSLNSLNSVGYKEVMEYLEGRLDFDVCVDLVKQNTRRYAKRQLTWFRADKEIRWLIIEKDQDFQAAAETISQAYRDAMGAKEV